MSKNVQYRKPKKINNQCEMCFKYLIGLNIYHIGLVTNRTNEPTDEMRHIGGKTSVKRRLPKNPFIT